MEEKCVLQFLSPWSCKDNGILLAICNALVMAIELILLKIIFTNLSQNIIESKCLAMDKWSEKKKTFRC